MNKEITKVILNKFLELKTCSTEKIFEFSSCGECPMGDICVFDFHAWPWKNKSPEKGKLPWEFSSSMLNRIRNQLELISYEGQ